MKHLIFVRHGKTDDSDGVRDLPLNQVGVLQMDSLAMMLKHRLFKTEDAPPLVFFVSERIRARGSAEILKHELNQIAAPVFILPELAKDNPNPEDIIKRVTEEIHKAELATGIIICHSPSTEKLASAAVRHALPQSDPKLHKFPENGTGWAIDMETANVTRLGTRFGE